MWFGANVQLLMESSSPNAESEITEFRKRGLDFDITLSQNIMKRFDFGSQKLIFMANFKPSVVLSGRIKLVLPKHVS